MADEYIDVVYRLWEGSREDGAVRRDKAACVFTDASRVHPIGHEGNTSRSGISPVRTFAAAHAGHLPVGCFRRGRQFASKYAEGMFILTTSIAQSHEVTNNSRDQAEKQGRGGDSIKIFTLLTVMTGATDAAAEHKYQERLLFELGPHPRPLRRLDGH